jgi:DNA-binding response OmpR family regulator
MTSQRLEGVRVLIVDDDPDILSSMALAMRAEGAQTETAADGNTAVSMFLQSPPDLIVLDMMLPKRSGFLVLEKIRELEDPPPVIMVTANQGKRHQVYAQSLGVAAYLNKPVPLSRLVAKAVEILEADDDDE